MPEMLYASDWPSRKDGPNVSSVDLKVAMSLKATVMPPPVNGWRMLNESPSKTAPFVRFGFAGIVLFGIALKSPRSTAIFKYGCTRLGTCGKIFSKTYFAIDPSLTRGIFTCEGISTKHRTSLEEIG